MQISTVDRAEIPETKRGSKCKYAVLYNAISNLPKNKALKVACASQKEKHNIRCSIHQMQARKKLKTVTMRAVNNFLYISLK